MNQNSTPLKKTYALKEKVEMPSIATLTFLRMFARNYQPKQDKDIRAKVSFQDTSYSC